MSAVVESLVLPPTPDLTIPEARALLSPQDFRLALRRTLLDHSDLTLQSVASVLGVSRQRVAALVGPLDKPHPAPRRDQARTSLAELSQRVRTGESAESACLALGISLSQAMSLGFRVKSVRPPHGQGREGCECWRCRRAARLVRPRGPRGRRVDPRQAAEVADWLAWVDPDDGRRLTQREIGRLAGVGQGRVSRVAGRLAEARNGD